MSIKAKDAIRIARSLIGTPYAELDCINLIKKVIRTAPGGVKAYTTAGTNALWDSYTASGKYRHLTWRQESTVGAVAGMLAFKRDGEDVHHVGIVTESGTVVHSSSAQGGRGVVETPLDSSWQLLAVHRYIEPEVIEMSEPIYKAQVVTRNDPLNVREFPKTGRIIGKINPGKVIDVMDVTEDGGWARIVFNELTGYVSTTYLAEAEAEDESKEPQDNAPVITLAHIVIIDSAGNRFAPVGDFRVLVDGVD